MNKNDENKVWKTKDGQLLSISEMESTHLLNAMNMMRRNAEAAYAADPLMLTEAGIESEHLLPPVYKDMARELAVRNMEPPPQRIRKLEL